MKNDSRTMIPFADARQFGQIIRAHRKCMDLRIDDAALLCGVSVALLSALENGSRPVGLPKALRVAQQLGIVLFADPKKVSDQSA